MAGHPGHSVVDAAAVPWVIVDRPWPDGAALSRDGAHRQGRCCAIRRGPSVVLVTPRPRRLPVNEANRARDQAESRSGIVPQHVLVNQVFPRQLSRPGAPVFAGARRAGSTSRRAFRRPLAPARPRTPRLFAATYRPPRAARALPLGELRTAWRGPRSDELADCCSPRPWGPPRDRQSSASGSRACDRDPPRSLRRGYSPAGAHREQRARPVDLEPGTRCSRSRRRSSLPPGLAPGRAWNRRGDHPGAHGGVAKDDHPAGRCTGTEIQVPGVEAVHWQPGRSLGPEFTNLACRHR